MRDLSTMSIGLSIMLSMARIGLTVAGVASGARVALIVAVVISPSGSDSTCSCGMLVGVAFFTVCGVGGVVSAIEVSALEAMELLGAVLLRFRGGVGVDA